MPAFASTETSLSAPLPAAAKATLKRRRNLQPRRSIHLASLQTFFEDPAHFNLMHSVLSGRFNLSLRLLEYLCTTYARRPGGVSVTRDDGSVCSLDAVYQDRIVSHGKSFFDPFCRSSGQAQYTLRNGTRKCHTNVAQMRFFKFAITHGVIAYARENAIDLETSMRRGLAQPRVKRMRTETVTSSAVKLERVVQGALEGEGPPEIAHNLGPANKRPRVAPHATQYVVKMHF